MAKIYKFFYGKPREAWYEFSQGEQNDFLARVNEAREQVGGKLVVICDTGWASDRWYWFGVEEFPDLEAVQKHARLLQELNLFRYVESASMLGTELQPPG